MSADTRRNNNHYLIGHYIIRQADGVHINVLPTCEKKIQDVGGNAEEMTDTHKFVSLL